MKRIGVIAVLVVALGMLAGVVAASGSTNGPPLHGHVLLLGLELDESGEPVGFRKCVELAAGQALPLNAHHAHAHTGRAGEALFERAGHLVVPLAPLSPFEDCEDIEEFLANQ